MPGPPPNPNAIRRNARVGPVVLPSSGRTGRTPKWPLPESPRLVARIRLIEDDVEALEERELDEDLSRTERTKLTRLRERLAVAVLERDTIKAEETRLWRALWKTPQAVAWERQHWTYDVALYVRHLAAAGVGSMEDAKEARLRADGLGLTPKGLKALMWQIDDQDELANRRAGTAAAGAATGTDGGGSRSRRMKAVDGKGS